MTLNYSDKTFAKLSEEANRAYLFKYSDIFERTFTEVRFPSFNLNDPNFHNNVCTFQSVDLNLYNACQKRKKDELLKASKHLKEKLNLKIEQLKSIDSSDAKQNLLIFEGFDESWFDVENLIIQDGAVSMLCWGIVPKYIKHLRNKEFLSSKTPLPGTESKSFLAAGTIITLVFLFLAFIAVIAIIIIRNDVNSGSDLIDEATLQSETLKVIGRNSIEESPRWYESVEESLVSINIRLAHMCNDGCYCANDDEWNVSRMQGIEIEVWDMFDNRICVLDRVDPKKTDYKGQECYLGHLYGDCFISKEGAYTIMGIDRNKAYQNFREVIKLSYSKKNYEDVIELKAR